MPNLRQQLLTAIQENSGSAIHVILEMMGYAQLPETQKQELWRTLSEFLYEAKAFAPDRDEDGNLIIDVSMPRNAFDDIQLVHFDRYHDNLVPAIPSHSLQGILLSGDPMRGVPAIREEVKQAFPEANMATIETIHLMLLNASLAMRS